MPSEELKDVRKQRERKLYEPVKRALETIFSVHYIEKKEKYQHRPTYVRNPHLEITASGKFSETLKREFNDEALNILNAERIRPDIMGFVQKKPSSPKELITVEVKVAPIRIVDVAKAKLYQDIFNATFSLVVSPKGIPEEKLRLVLNKDTIRGKVIITQFAHYDERLGIGVFQIHPKLRNVPKPFNKCIIRE